MKQLSRTREAGATDCSRWCELLRRKLRIEEGGFQKRRLQEPWPMKKADDLPWVSCRGNLRIILACSQAARGMVESKASLYNYGEKRYVCVHVDAGVIAPQDRSKLKDFAGWVCCNW